MSGRSTLQEPIFNIFCRKNKKYLKVIVSPSYYCGELNPGELNVIGENHPLMLAYTQKYYNLFWRNNLVTSLVGYGCIKV